MPTNESRLDLLAFIYGNEAAPAIDHKLDALLDRYRGRLPAPKARGVTEKDGILITYGDMVRAPGETPLATLAQFLEETAAGPLSGVHILPFFPYSSDDGFSVIDYREVDPQLGDWEDIALVGRRFRLMFDAVINHISAESRWFQGFLRGEEPYTDYFVVVPPETDLSAVFRPRALPLLTPFETAGGTRHVWTTFSADQVDLNFANPAVLCEIVDVLLTYVVHGAEFIRLDAIGFMWKEIGTSSIHLPQTHALVQLLRLLLDEVAPHTALITETNVPHQDNISYFGDGTNEAQMVYNFSLPPLTLHAFISGDASILTRWAHSLTLPSDRVTFFNFLASHDGIGVTPARGYLSDEAITAIGERVKRLGGYVSYKTLADGSQTEYELNINFLDALGIPGETEPAKRLAARFLAAQSIMLALRGVPGIYFHSLFGSRNWAAGVEQTGRFRTINREKLAYAKLKQELADPDSLRARIFYPYLDMIRVRGEQPAFDPYGAQEVLALDPAVFAVLRGREETAVLCLTNVRPEPVVLEIPAGVLPGRLRDLLHRETLPGRRLTLPPYGVRWLTKA